MITKEYFMECMNGWTSDEMYEWLSNLNFFEAPASISHHGAYEGGLFEHSLAVTKELVNLTNSLGLKWEKPFSPYIVGMYHDLCKCDNYILTPDNKWEYNKSQMLPGHGEKSVILLQQRISLTAEELYCIRWHMGAFDEKENWNRYGQAVETYPNVLYTHTADMIASRIIGI